MEYSSYLDAEGQNAAMAATKKIKKNLKLKRRLQDTEGTIYTAYMLT